AESLRATSRVVAQAAVVDGMRRALQTRTTHADEFATTFAGDMDAAITGAKKSLTAIQTRLRLARTEAERMANLHTQNVVSQTELDAARGAVAELERELAIVESALSRSTERRRAARGGVFLLEDGNDGNSTFQKLADARLRLVQADSALTQVRAEEKA